MKVKAYVYDKDGKFGGKPNEQIIELLLDIFEEYKRMGRTFAVVLRKGTIAFWCLDGSVEMKIMAIGKYDRHTNATCEEVMATVSQENKYFNKVVITYREDIDCEWLQMLVEKVNESLEKGVPVC